MRMVYFATWPNEKSSGINARSSQIVAPFDVQPQGMGADMHVCKYMRTRTYIIRRDTE